MNNTGEEKRQIKLKFVSTNDAFQMLLKGDMFMSGILYQQHVNKFKLELIYLWRVYVIDIN